MSLVDLTLHLAQDIKTLVFDLLHSLVMTLILLHCVLFSLKQDFVVGVHVVLDLVLKQVLASVLDDCWTLPFIFDHFLRNVRDDGRDHNLQSEQAMLDENTK